MEVCWFGRAVTELPVRTGERRGCPGWRVARPKEDQGGVEEALEGSRSIQGREARQAAPGDAGAAGRGDRGLEAKKGMKCGV